MRRPLTEARFQSWAVEVFQRHGWLVKHAGVPARAVGGGRLVPDRRGTGMLDLLLVHPDQRRILFAECKDAEGNLTPEQKELVAALRPTVEWSNEVHRVAGVHPALGVHLFRPGAEALIEELAAGRPR